MYKIKVDLTINTKYLGITSQMIRFTIANFFYSFLNL